MLYHQILGSIENPFDVGGGVLETQNSVIDL